MGMRVKQSITLMLMAVLVGSAVGSVQSAYAGIPGMMIIDSFSDPVSTLCDLTDSTTGDGPLTATELGFSMIGGERTCYAELMSGDASTMSDVIELTEEEFQCNVGSDSTGECRLVYDALSGSEKNFFGADDIRIQYHFADQGHYVTIELTDGDGTVASLTELAPSHTIPATNSDVLFDFVLLAANIDTPGSIVGLDETNIVKIKVVFNVPNPTSEARTSALDLDVNFIDVTGITVGGIDIPIDTTALLLAGAESISMWMIPIIFAGIGVSVLVIKKRN